MDSDKASTSSPTTDATTISSDKAKVVEEVEEVEDVAHAAAPPAPIPARRPRPRGELVRRLPKTYIFKEFKSFDQLTPNNRSSMDQTVRAFEAAKAYMTHRTDKVFLYPMAFPIRRMMPRIQRANVDWKRPEVGDALVKQLYGTRLRDSKACRSCRRDKGPFEGCVIMPTVSEGCSNCHYLDQGHCCDANTTMLPDR